MSKAVIGEYKGNPTISLPLGATDREGNEKTFIFGVKKAQAILEHLEEIRKFVGDNS